MQELIEIKYYRIFEKLSLRKLRLVNHSVVVNRTWPIKFKFGTSIEYLNKEIMQESQDLLTNELEITDELKNYLLDAAKWGKFLAVTGLIGCFMMVAGAFYAGYYVSHLPSYSFGSSMGQAITAFYIFFAVIWFYPCLFLYKFSTKLIQALKSNSQEYVESAFINLRSAFKFLGVVSIVILSLWLLSFLLLVVKNLTG